MTRIAAAVIMLEAVGQMLAASRVELRCTNFSTAALVEPPLAASSGILVDFGLLSESALCTDPPRRPRFKTLYLSDVSLIALCPHCPQCTVTLPAAFELPVTTTLRQIFLVGRQLPYNRHHSDIDVRYVIVDRLPSSTKNCEVVVDGRSATFVVPTRSALMDWSEDRSNIVLACAVMASLCCALCLIRCTCARLFERKADRLNRMTSAAYGRRPPPSSSYAPSSRALILDHASCASALSNARPTPQPPCVSIAANSLLLPESAATLEPPVGVV